MLNYNNLNKDEIQLKADFQKLADKFFDKHKYFPPIQSVGYNIKMEHVEGK